MLHLYSEHISVQCCPSIWVLHPFLQWLILQDLKFPQHSWWRFKFSKMGYHADWTTIKMKAVSPSLIFFTIPHCIISQKDWLFSDVGYWIVVYKIQSSYDIIWKVGTVMNNEAEQRYFSRFLEVWRNLLGTLVRTSQLPDWDVIWQFQVSTTELMTFCFVCSQRHSWVMENVHRISRGMWLRLVNIVCLHTRE